MRDVVHEKTIIHGKQISINDELVESFGVLEILADEITLARAFSNVIDNGIEAMSASKEKVLKISIAPGTSLGYVAVCILDTGCGMGPEVIQKLGNRGFSFGKGSEGNGLGVNFAKTYITSLGGRISFSSQIGVGTKVRIELPLVIRNKTKLDFQSLNSQTLNI